MAEQVQLDLPVVLPHVPDATDACVDRLTDCLRGQPGVSRAHVVPATNGAPDRLCVHYDPDTIARPRIRRRVRSVGADLTDRYGHLSWAVEGISRPRRARTIAKRLRQINGVVEAEARAAEQIRVEYDRSSTSADEIRDVLRSMNVRPQGDRLAAEAGRGDREEEHDHDHGGIFGEKTELIVAVAAGVCVALGVGLSVVGGTPGWVPWGLYVGAYALGGYHTVREAVETLRAGEFEVDFLMLAVCRTLVSICKAKSNVYRDPE